MLIIDNFTTAMPYIRCKLNKIVTYRHYRYTSRVWNKKIFVTGVTQELHGVKKLAKRGQNANYRQLHYGNAIYSRQVEQNRYLSSLQIYLDSVKWKIFVTGVTKHFQGVKNGAKWAKTLIINNFTTVMPYIRCNLNKIVTYRHYRYTLTVWNEKYSLLG